MNRLIKVLLLILVSKNSYCQYYGEFSKIEKEKLLRDLNYYMKV